MPRQVVVCQTKEHLFEASAQFLSQALSLSSNSATGLSIALSGGSTPRGLFTQLVTDPYRSRVHWSSIRIFWGDERPVPPEHPESNYRMAKETLLDHVPHAPDQVFRIQGELPPEEAAEGYEKVLQRTFSLRQGEVPCFDMILLGMGADGHTASLFPGTSVLDERRQWVTAPWVQQFQTHRITLTPPVFNGAKQIMFVVSGLDKADAAQAVLEGPLDPHRYPAQLVCPTHGNVIWFMDAEAASRLEETPLTQWDREKGRVLLDE